MKFNELSMSFIWIYGGGGGGEESKAAKKK